MVTSARTAISQKGSVAAHEDFSQKADNVSYLLSYYLSPCTLLPHTSHIFPKPSHIYIPTCTLTHTPSHPHTHPATPSHISPYPYTPHISPHSHSTLPLTHSHISPQTPHPLHTLTHTPYTLTHTPHTLTHTLHMYLLTHIPSPSQLVSAVHDVYNVVDKHYNPPPPPPRPPSPTPESKQPFSLGSFPGSLLKRNREPVITGLGGSC